MQWWFTIECIKWSVFCCSSIGWRLGLQAVTGVVSLLFLLGTFYRSASLYHPQRRAILHLKSQKRKIKSKDKEKNKAHDDTPPLFDFTTLKSRTVQILLLSTSVAAFGLNTPLLYMVILASCHATWYAIVSYCHFVFKFLLGTTSPPRRH